MHAMALAVMRDIDGIKAKLAHMQQKQAATDATVHAPPSRAAMPRPSVVPPLSYSLPYSRTHPSLPFLIARFVHEGARRSDLVRVHCVMQVMGQMEMIRTLIGK